ncbi:Firmicu-CTERM sorting domain-containing protein [Lactiplantibacillus garii]|nr:Firmicu-CTERM sorting domain-containing protein [Lactiplantibacillus garii]
MKKKMALLLGSVGLLFGLTATGVCVNAQAATVNWDNVTKTKLGWYYTTNVAVTQNSHQVSFYVDTGTNPAWYNIPTHNYDLTVGNHHYSVHYEQSGSTVTFSAMNTDTWKDLGTVGSGTLTTKNGLGVLIGSISYQALGLAAEQTVPVSLGNSELGSEAVQGVFDDQTTGTTTGSSTETDSTATSSSSSTETSSAATSSSSSTATSSATSSSSSSTATSSSSSATKSSSTTSDPAKQAVDGAASDVASSSSSQANNNNVNGSLGITIDGDMSDWADKDKQAMTSKGDNDNVKNVALLTDDQAIYAYVGMHPKLAGGYTNFMPSGYTIDIGGKTYYITFNNGTTVNLAVGQKQAVTMNIYGDNQSTNLTGMAYVTRSKITQKNGNDSDYDGTAYSVEFKVPFDKLTGVSKTSGQTITLANQNLWTGSVQSSGGSTGPVVLASVGFVIAIGSVIGVVGLKPKKWSH